MTEDQILIRQEMAEMRKSIAALVDQNMKVVSAMERLATIEERNTALTIRMADLKSDHKEELQDIRGDAKETKILFEKLKTTVTQMQVYWTLGGIVVTILLTFFLNLVLKKYI